LIPINPAAQEAVTRGLQVQGQPKDISNIPSEKQNLKKKAYNCSSNGDMLAFLFYHSLSFNTMTLIGIYIS
jgi:hypothetical protein